MANEEHLKIIKQGVSTWNAWREEHPAITPDLSGADLIDARLHRAHLTGADLTKAKLSGADLSEADLTEADLSKADLNKAELTFAYLPKARLRKANLIAADLVGATLSGANLSEADFTEAILAAASLGGANLSAANFTRADLDRADLSTAILRGANLGAADLTSTNLREADLNGATVGWTVFGNTDLSNVKGLEAVTHEGPSTIGVDTLYRSQGHIPEVFLRGAGLPEEFITQIPALIASVKPIQFQSCFISYSHQDEAFARRLHAAMRSENLRVWFAPEEMKGGKKLHEQIFHAIQVHDRLLLVLSTDSIKSNWVITEIKRAKKVEREENRRKLFPIRLVDFETIQKWECFDADSGKDLAVEVREYYIPDLSNWKDHDAFEVEFAKLLRALKATEG